MNVKRVLGFLLLKPVFTSRNLTSLVLVAFFFGVYVLAGGEVTSIPDVAPDQMRFGGINSNAPQEVQKPLKPVPPQPLEKESVAERLRKAAAAQQESATDTSTRARLGEQDTEEQAAEPGTGGELSDLEMRLKRLRERTPGGS